MRRVYTIGEILIDFSESEIGVPLKERFPVLRSNVDAPVNVAVTVTA